jgi:hypothetical protein
MTLSLESAATGFIISFTSAANRHVAQPDCSRLRLGRPGSLQQAIPQVCRPNSGRVAPCSSDRAGVISKRFPVDDVLQPSNHHE